MTIGQQIIHGLRDLVSNIRTGKPVPSKLLFGPPMNCCGQAQVTRFCATCGKQLFKHQLSGLLRHCHNISRHHQTWLTRFRKKLKRVVLEPDRTDLMDQIAQREKVAAKWSAWASELQRLMDRDDECRPTTQEPPQ